MTAIIFILIILLSNFLIFLFYKKLSKNINLIDLPDSFIKLHKYPTPLLGGFFIFFSLLIYFFTLLSFSENFRVDIFASNKSLFNFFFLCSTFFFIGYLDDKFKISPNKKFLTFILILIAAVLLDKNLLIDKLSFTFTEKEIFLENFSIYFTILCIMLFVNAFNLFDGVNCQAGLYSIFLLVVLYIAEINIYLILTFFIPLVFFLYLNSKGKIFLGNTGSYLLPVAFSQIFILSYNQNYFKADEVLFFLIFPGLDMFRLFIERSFKMQNPFKGDHNHLHHLILNRFNIFFTLTITVGFKALLYSIYIYTEVEIIYFLIIIVFYYLFLYLLFKKK
tara:strand:+ start:117 stop:1118 length:1002 start_codon:yes stop_codon:yes gene_type:complete